MRRQVVWGQVRRVLLSVIGLLITVGLAEASPEKAKWRREILLAANDSLFAALVYSWDQPGTYYQHSDSVAFALRRNVDGSTVLQYKLWDTLHKMDEKTNIWGSERHSNATLELGEAFTRYSLKTVPPYSHSLIAWALDEHGVYFSAVNQRNKTIVLREDVLPMEQIEARFPE